MYVGYLYYECQRAGVPTGWPGGLLPVEYEHYRTLLNGTGTDVEGRVPLPQEGVKRQRDESGSGSGGGGGGSDSSDSSIRWPSSVTLESDQVS